MVWVTNFVKPSSILLFIIVLSAAQSSSKDVNITSLNEHVKKMDAVLQEVQSHAQAQEQKYSAVLSSVLSQLTQTTEELSASKNITEELQQKIENLEIDYRTATARLAKMEQNLNQSRVELEMAKDIQERVNRMDTELQKAQSRAKAQEEQSKAILTHLLSQVTQNTHKLMGSENSTEDLQQVAKELSGFNDKTELDSSTTQGELAEMKQVQSKILLELRDLKHSQNKTIQDYLRAISGSKHRWAYIDVGFEAYLTNATTILPSGNIVFDKVIHNEGHGYDPISGYFTAPVSGTYLFWTHIVYKSNSSAIVLNIETRAGILGRAYGRADEAFGTASTTTLYHLMKGDRTWIRPVVEVALQAMYPSAGTLLIKQDN